MEFVDVPFPDCLAFGAQSDAMWQTLLPALPSGVELPNQQWSQNKHTYEAGLTVRPASEYLLARAHFNIMRGRTKSFPFKDFLDFAVAQAAGVLTFIRGTNWLMYYRYGSGSEA
jgi:uncharacterized protein (TIGR02217 family)